MSAEENLQNRKTYSNTNTSRTNGYTKKQAYIDSTRGLRDEVEGIYDQYESEIYDKQSITFVPSGTRKLTRE